MREPLTTLPSYAVGAQVSRTRIAVRAHPGAARERVAWTDGVLHVWVTAPAVDGRANLALVRAIARGLGVRRSEVALVAGERSRDKVVEVTQ